MKSLEAAKASASGAGWDSPADRQARGLLRGHLADLLRRQSIDPRVFSRGLAYWGPVFHPMTRTGGPFSLAVGRESPAHRAVRRWVDIFHDLAARIGAGRAAGARGLVELVAAALEDDRLVEEVAAARVEARARARDLLQKHLRQVRRGLDAGVGLDARVFSSGRQYWKPVFGDELALEEGLDGFYVPALQRVLGGDFMATGELERAGKALDRLLLETAG